MDAEDWRIAPVLLVADIHASLAYWGERLGFGHDGVWGEPPSFAIVRRAGTAVMLKQLVPAPAGRANHRLGGHDSPWDAYIWVGDADALHAEFVARGARITSAPYDAEHGCREFEVEDPDGYRICFGHVLIP